MTIRDTGYFFLFLSLFKILVSLWSMKYVQEIGKIIKRRVSHYVKLLNEVRHAPASIRLQQWLNRINQQRLNLRAGGWPQMGLGRWPFGFIGRTLRNYVRCQYLIQLEGNHIHFCINCKSSRKKKKMLQIK